jgi:arylsulfatase A
MKALKSFSLFISIGSCLLAKGADKPNIILILADDMGWNGLSSFGNQYVQTPNIDRLAAEGMKFTNAYASSVCSPTRASLISGQSEARHNIVGTGGGQPFAATLCPPKSGEIPRSSYTIAEPLRDNGYECAVMGKWHVYKYEVSAAFKQGGGFAYFNDFGFNHVCAAGEGANPKTKSDKAVDTLTNYTLNFIEQNYQKPFFAYVSHFTVHHTLHAPDSLVQKYVNKGFPLNNSYDNRPSAKYLAMINHFDNSVGRILDKLEQLGIANNTMVILSSDNGGVNNYWDHGPLRGFKGSMYEGGIRVPFLVRWPEKVAAGTVCDVPIQLTDLYPTFIDINGIAPKADYPLDGESIYPLLKQDGNLNREAIFWHRPCYQPKYAGTPTSVIRKGDYKLLFYYNDYLKYDPSHNKSIGSFYGDLYIGKKVELFNIKVDIGETNNLASSMHELTNEMVTDLKNFLQKINVKLPIANPHFDSINWRKGGSLPAYTAPDYNSVFNLSDTASVKFEYKGDGSNTAQSFFIETFGDEAPDLTEYAGGVHGSRLDEYSGYDNTDIEFVPTSNSHFSIVTPELSSEDFGGSGGSALFFGAASASEKCIIKNINTLGYDSVRLSYSILKGTAANSTIAVKYSVNEGTGWTELSNTGTATIGEWRHISPPDILPSVANLWIELGVQRQYTLFDDIRLSGILKGSTNIRKTRMGKAYIYPNPANNTITVVRNEDVVKMELICMEGKVLREVFQTNTMYLNGINNGTYVLRFKTKNCDINTEKIIVHNQE